jgi:hypothetical protein
MVSFRIADHPFTTAFNCCPTLIVSLRFVPYTHPNFAEPRTA